MILQDHPRFHSFSQVSFCGVPCAQQFVDFYIWEAVLNDRMGVIYGRTEGTSGFPKLKAIVELGTFQGGFSLYLAQQAQQRGLEFRTYDVFRPEHEIPGFVQLDIFAEADSIGQYLRERDPLILFCDGGNKPREIKTFSQYLTSDSVIAVHDWGTEMSEDDIPPWMTMVYQDFCEELESPTRFFVRVDV